MIDILGFTEGERIRYAKAALEDQPHKINDLVDCLNSYPVISSLCYIPLNMTILLQLFIHEISIPVSSAELYEYFACIRCHINDLTNCDITKLIDLSEPYNKRVQQLSKLSFEALINPKLLLASLWFWGCI